MNRRQTSCALAGIAIVLAGINAGCSKNGGDQRKLPRDTSVPVTIAKVELVPLDRSLPVVGTLFPKDEATIGAQVEGRVEKTAVDFGQQVAAGQELALIDTASYEALCRQSAATLAKARANALNAEQNLKRVAELQQDKISSASELDLATAQAEQARAEVKATEAADAVARLNLERSRAKAPFEGMVAERLASGGDYVKVGAPLFRLVNDAELKYIVQAPERYAAQVKPEQLVRFTVDAWPRDYFEGKVYLISPAVSLSNRSFNLGARVANADRKLKANSFARGELILERAVPTPVVPLEAILNFAGVTKVFVIQDNTARSREIKAGRIKDGRQEVLEGLRAGEVIALSGQTKLYEGTKVRIQSSSPTRNGTS